jgi:class 3 adenylate cyclase/tetratricopeptide (TPR) repeat protein
MSEIREWLKTLGLERYAEAFEREEVGVGQLAELADEELRALGVPLGPRKTILKAAGVAHGPVASPPAPDSYTPPHLAERILSSRAALEGERKQVSVLFCDIADSTGLAAQVGAEAMHAILTRFFHLVMDEVHRYEGTVNQFLGDGLMALFGAPLAHEDHARRAVLAALGIRGAIATQQKQLGLPPGSQLSVRIGLHTGPVVVGSIGDNLRMDYTAIGDTTNLAARLQHAARPGQILVSEATARLVEGYVRLQRLAPLSVKGRAEPVDALEVTAAGQRRSRLEQERALSPFVGREREVDVLRQALEEALAGRGQVVGIVGEPGVGKSRVLYEFRRLLAERGAVYLEGWCQSFGQSIPYLPLQDLVRAVADVGHADPPVRIAQRIEAALVRSGMSPVEDAPYLLRLLGIEEHGKAPAGMTPEAIQARTLEVLTRMLFAAGGGRPLVLGIEDLHWIDKSSEAFFIRFVDALAGAPILLLTTARPGYSAPWVAKSYATQLALHVLSPEASRRVVEATAQRSGLEDMTADAILRRAEGNPLFLEELTLGLEAQPRTIAAQTLPDTIQGVLAARIDRLPEGAKRTLQSASVLGREFPLRLVRRIVADAGLDRELAALTQLEFLFEHAAQEGPVYTFKHVLTQEVAYDSLLSARRQALHEAAGRAIEAFYPDRLEEHCEVLAHHFSRSAAAERALDYLELANRKAARANAVLDARAYFEEAMRVLDALPDDLEHRRRRIALTVEQVHVYVLTNGLYEFQRRLEEQRRIAEELGDDALLGHLHACRGHILFMLGCATEAALTLRHAAELCERAGNFRGAAHAYAHLQWAQLQKGEYEDVLRIEAASLRSLAQAPDMRLLIYALTATAWACAMLGRWEQGVERGRSALAESERVRDASLASFSYTFGLSILYRHWGKIEEAIDCGCKAVASAQTPAERQWAEGFYADALTQRDAAAAAAILKPIVAFYRSAGLDWPECWASTQLAEACLLLGRHQQARADAARVVELGGRLDIRLCATPAQRLLGEICLSAGDPEALAQARHHFEQAIASCERSKAENQLALAWAGYGRLQARLGNDALAREYLENALQTFERLGTLGQPQRVRADLAALAAQTSTTTLP